MVQWVVARHVILLKFGIIIKKKGKMPGRADGAGRLLLIAEG